MLRGPLKLRLEDQPGSEALAARIRAQGLVLAGPGEEADLVARALGPAPLGPAAPSALPGDGAQGGLKTGPKAGPPRLPAREIEILGYLADGWSNEEIASVLGIGVRTVRFHLAKLYGTLGVGRRGEAVREALRLGIISLDF